MKHSAVPGVLVALALALPASAAQSGSSGGLLGNIVGSTASSITTSAGNFLVGLADCVELNGGVGPGFKLGLEALVVRIGFGRVFSTRIGLDGRQMGTWSERDAMVGLAPFTLLLAPCELMRGRGETWKGLASAFEYFSLGVERIERDNLRTSTILYHKSTMIGGWHERPGDRFSMGGEAHLLYLGGRLRLKPLQMVGGLLSLFGMDISQSLAHPEFAGYPQGRPR